MNIGRTEIEAAPPDFSLKNSNSNRSRTGGSIFSVFLKVVMSKSKCVVLVLVKTKTETETEANTQYIDIFRFLDHRFLDYFFLDNLGSLQ